MDSLKYHYDKMIDAMGQQAEDEEPVTFELLDEARKIGKAWERVTKEENKLSSSWLRFLVSTGAVLLGVLVALHDATTGTRPMRFCFVVAVVSLAMSILNLGAATYSELYHTRKGRRMLDKEIESMRQHPHEWDRISIPRSRIFEVFAVVGYICFALSLLALCAYILLSLQVP